MSNYNPYQINLFNPNHKRSISPNLMKGSFSRQKIGFSKPFPFQSGPKRDITPLRKYNQPVKKNITKKAPSTQLKMEGDLLTATKGSGVNVNNKRANSPFNVVSHRPNINLNASTLPGSPIKSHALISDACALIAVTHGPIALPPRK